MRALAGAAAAALLLAVAPAGASKVQATSGYAPQVANAYGAVGADAVPVTRATPLPAEMLLSAAVSTPLSLSASTTVTFGPWSPQLGRDVYLAFAIVGGTASLAVVVTTDGLCTDGYQLSAANGTYVRGAFSGLAAGRYREDIGAEMQAGAQWCVTITPSSGATVAGSLAQ